MADVGDIFAGGVGGGEPCIGIGGVAVGLEYCDCMVGVKDEAEDNTEWIEAEGAVGEYNIPRPRLGVVAFERDDGRTPINGLPDVDDTGEI